MMTDINELGTQRWKSFSQIYRHGKKSRIKTWFFVLLGLLLIILFLPWTQNVRGTGYVTTLRQEERPQEINTIISGKVLKWHVKEGDYVQQGDTILQLEEIKVDYLDPKLLSRTADQLTAKQLSIDYYKEKVTGAGSQLNAMDAGIQLKIDQLKNKLVQLDLKINSEQNELAAAENDFRISAKQFDRQKALYDSGLVSLTQLEQRNQVYQNALSKKISAQNKLANTRQDILNTNIEINASRQDYNEKTAKTRGEQFQSLSEINTKEGDVAKLQNQYSNYSIRNGMYVIRAPQSGQITQAKKAGLGEVVKEGEMVVQIVPNAVEYAVELFVKPVDIPLIQKGQKIRFMFDGFPAIVFSGWPEGSFGTFGGVVTSVESAVSSNGLFRVLAKRDSADKLWPKRLSIGAGANAMALLKDVPIWYELWRNINGFPPDYYLQKKEKEAKKYP